MNLYEVNAPELLPYIEGYAHTGNWNSAEELTMKAIGLSSRMTRDLMQHLGADSCRYSAGESVRCLSEPARSGCL